MEASLYSVFNAFAAGTAGLSSVIAYFLFADELSSGGAATAFFTGALFLAAVLGALFDLWGFIHDTPGLVILGLCLGLLSAGIAGILVDRGAAGDDPSTGDSLFSILLCGGFTAGAEIGKLVAE